MVTGDEARDRLDAFRRPDNDRPRDADDQVHLSEDGRRVLGWLGRWGRQEDTRTMGALVDGLSEDERLRVLEAVSPQLADGLAHWWQAATAQPYQGSWTRRGYRSSRPEDSLAKRAEDLHGMCMHASNFDQPPEWWARWSIHVTYGHFAGLLASEVDRGNQAVRAVLLAAVAGRDEIAKPSADVLGALARCADPEAWEALDRLLRAAGRQEGLRQTILETVDLAHEGARRLLVTTVVDEGHTRFAGAIRAVGTWWGEEFEVRQDKQVRAHLASWLPMLDSPPEDLADLDAADALLALHAHALRDAHTAIDAGHRLLAHESAEHRLAAIRVLAEIDLPESRAAAAAVVDDPDLRVAAVAIEAVTSTGGGNECLLAPEGAAAVLAVLPGLPKKTQPLATGLLGKRQSKIGRAHVADALLMSAGEDLESVVEPATEHASAQGRATKLWRLCQDPDAHRTELMAALTDLSSQNRRLAAQALSGVEEITAEEALTLEAALSRKASDQRTIALRFLSRQQPDGVATSIARLNEGTADQQRGADELATTAAAATGEAEAVESPSGVIAVRASDRTPPTRPSVPSFAAAHPAVAANVQYLVDSLEEHLERHARTEVVVHSEPQPLSTVHWLPRSGEGVPLPEVFGEWWEATSAALTDGGLEALLLADFRPADESDWAARASQRVLGDVRWPETRAGAGSLAGEVVHALARASLRESWVDPYLHAVREVAADLGSGHLLRPLAAHAARGEEVRMTEWGHRDDSDSRTALEGLGGQRWSEFRRRGSLTAAHLADLWPTLRWIDEPDGAFDPVEGGYVVSNGREPGLYSHGVDRVPDAPYRHRPSGDLVVMAYDAGLATRGDLADCLLDGNMLRAVTQHRPHEHWARQADLLEVAGELRDAVVEAEIRRGDMPVPTSPVARQVTSVPGAARLAELVLALGTRPFTRGYAWGQDREASLSRLVRATWPAADDTDAAIDAALGRIPEKRLIDVALYAPQWAAHVERAVGWPGLESGVWWLFAHTKDDSWMVPAEIREEWATQVSRHTPLEADELVRGATDVSWFAEMFDALGPERFQALLAASKYASSSGGHKRAELFSLALRGLVGEDELLERIGAKRHQDSVRALGLLPVPDGDAAVVLRRYEILRGWVATDRSSGSQRRASETTAVEVAMDNLARSAGYRDPQRLVWAMEATAIADLVDGPLTATDGDLTVALSLDDGGRPVLDVRRGEKTLASVPAASAKRVPEIAALKSRVTALRKQSARMRASLETACVRGETFSTAELADLFAHPMLAPMLRELVLVSDEGVLGFADDAGHVRKASGEVVALDGSPVRVAHPVDLLASDEWPALQHKLFTARRTQPFKQVFRELYGVTAAELSVVDKSRRYAGQQVQSRQAGGLFRTRGWVTDFEVGFIKTFHAERLTVFCSLLDGWGTPAEVEDATIQDVWFVGRDGPVPLADVPPRLFSEVMRDLDLVVSIAHSGGVDPETSESAVEVRRRLVEETAQMMSLSNVEVKGHHAFVEGTIASYSVQLGSGNVHRLPGNAVCIIPISAQHRGRVFLPFADDDPRTAEVVSKVLLLARDDKIQDPSILAQLR